MSVLVPTYQVIQGKESVANHLDSFLQNYLQLEESAKTKDISKDQQLLTNSFYWYFIKYPLETSNYILEATKVVTKHSLFTREALRVINTACSKNNDPHAYYCKGELHRCKVLQDDIWLSKSTLFYKRAAELGHQKGLQRYQENRKAQDAHYCLQKPFSDPTSPMYHKKGLDTYHELVVAGRYEFAAPMLNVFESAKDEKNIHRLLKYLKEKIPNNPQLAFMYKEHKKDMIWYYLKKTFKIGLFLFYLYLTTDWIISKLYFDYHAPLFVIICNLYIYLAPGVYAFMNTRKVFSLLLAFFTPSQNNRDNWDCLVDCLLISMLF